MTPKGWHEIDGCSQTAETIVAQDGPKLAPLAPGRFLPASCRHSQFSSSFREHQSAMRGGDRLEARSEPDDSPPGTVSRQRSNRLIHFYCCIRSRYLCALLLSRIPRAGPGSVPSRPTDGLLICTPPAPCICGMWRPKAPSTASPTRWFRTTCESCSAEGKPAST